MLRIAKNPPKHIEHSNTFGFSDKHSDNLHKGLGEGRNLQAMFNRNYSEFLIHFSFCIINNPLIILLFYLHILINSGYENN